MPVENYYASIAVVELLTDSHILIESISVAKGECNLSGAWELSTSESQDISNILSGHSLIVLGDENEFKEFVNHSEYVYLKVDSFLTEARQAATEAIVAFENFKAQNPTKRKKVIAPSFYDWPESIDVNASAYFLESIGMMATPIGTPVKFKSVLSAARLIKHLINMWHLDEQQRSARIYVEGEDAVISILPNAWLRLATPI
jgi:hypothetical protein